MPKMIPGASKEFDNADPPTQKEQKSSPEPEIAKRDEKKITVGKAKYNFWKNPFNNFIVLAMPLTLPSIYLH